MLKSLTPVTPFAVGLVALTALAAPPANATPMTGDWASITMLSGGWIDPNIRATLMGTFYNPEACPMTDGYIIEAALSGAQLLESMLLTDYARGDQVRLILDGCTYQRPRVIAVDIRRSI